MLFGVGCVQAVSSRVRTGGFSTKLSHHTSTTLFFSMTSLIRTGTSHLRSDGSDSPKAETFNAGHRHWPDDSTVQSNSVLSPRSSASYVNLTRAIVHVYTWLRRGHTKPNQTRPDRQIDKHKLPQYKQSRRPAWGGISASTDICSICTVCNNHMATKK